MRLLFAFALLGTVLSGCEKCNPRPGGGISIGVGTSGVQTGASIGARCGPVSVGVGSGGYYHPYWY